LISLTDALSSKLTFRRLILEGNSLSLAAVTKSRTAILKSGAPDVNINFGSCIAEPVPVGSPAKVLIEEQDRVIMVSEAPEPVFEIPGQVSVPLEPAGGAAVLYTIESQKIKVPLRNPPSEIIDSEEGLDQKIVEASEGEIRLSWNINVCDFNNAGEEDIEGVIQVLSKAVLCWEVKSVSHSNQVTTLCSKTLLPDACLPIGSHITCSATVPKPPFRSKLEIGIKIVHSNVVKTTSRTLCVNAFALKVFSVPVDFNSSYVMYGGDVPVWSAASNALLGMTTPCGVPEGYEIARRVQWIGQHSQDLRLCFRAKLSATYDLSEKSDSLSVVNSTWKMAEGSTVGYSWCVCQCLTIGGVVEVASGNVTPGSVGGNSGQETDGGDDDGDVSSSLLQPWLWKDFTVPVEEASTNEHFILCVKVSSDPPVRNLSSKCKVQVDQCGFYVSGENYDRLQRDPVYENQANPSVLFSTFNCQSAATISL